VGGGVLFGLLLFILLSFANVPEHSCSGWNSRNQTRWY